MVENPEECLAVGHQRSAQYHNLIGFLPFKPQHCGQKLCGKYYLPVSHLRDKDDERKDNRAGVFCALLLTSTIPPHC
jgi:hypothetical protein